MLKGEGHTIHPVDLSKTEELEPLIVSIVKEEDNMDALRKIIEKKRPTVKGKNEYEVRGKLIRFALGRGFAMDDIMKVVGSLDECDEYMD